MSVPRQFKFGTFTDPVMLAVRDITDEKHAVSSAEAWSS